MGLNRVAASSRSSAGNIPAPPLSSGAYRKPVHKLRRVASQKSGCGEVSLASRRQFALRLLIDFYGGGFSRILIDLTGARCLSCFAGAAVAASADCPDRITPDVVQIRRPCICSCAPRTLPPSRGSDTKLRHPRGYVDADIDVKERPFYSFSDAACEGSNRPMRSYDFCRRCKRWGVIPSNGAAASQPFVRPARISRVEILWKSCG